MKVMFNLLINSASTLHRINSTFSHLEASILLIEVSTVSRHLIRGVVYDSLKNCFLPFLLYLFSKHHLSDTATYYYVFRQNWRKALCCFAMYLLVIMYKQSERISSQH